MRKVKEWVKNLSLSQQLFVLIFVFITFFASFFFVFLTSQVDEFVEEQMYMVIDRNQEMIGSLYRSNMDPQDIMSFQNHDTSVIYNVFYTEDGNYSIASEQFNNLPKLSDNISMNMYNQINQNIKVDHYSYTEGNVTAYYAINILSDDFAVVTVVTNEFRLNYRETLLGTVVNVTVMVVGLFFIVLMLWVAYLIHPLNQIRNYIEKIRLGENATLNVNRNDEIGELADAIVEMRQELERQEKTKEEMIHNISHDLKTPIATIKSYGESIKDGVYPYGTLEKSVDVIINNAERLEKKVYSLLYLNRVEYLVSQNTGEKETNMKRVIEEVLQAMIALRSDIQVETDLEEVYFKGASEPWRITVENILENAYRYAKDKIVILLDEDELTIYNNGPTISEDRLESLFKPFEKGKGGQFGIGLSIVYKVTQANGYTITGENTTDGVIFRIAKGH